MARIVFAMAMSHGPMIECPPEQWTTTLRAEDHRNAHLWFRKKHLCYDDMVRERLPERLERFLTPEETSRRHAATSTALAQLMRVYREVNPDILVIIGNDHREAFTTITPPFGIYMGAMHRSGLPTTVVPSEVFSSRACYGPSEPVEHPGLPDMARHVMAKLREDKFDVAVIEETPIYGREGRRVVPHAYSFIYHNMLNGNVPPSLPIHLNTFYPPNQPSMARVFEFSQSLIEAIKNWDTDQTVAIIGSGGLTHFIVDEEFDRQLIDALSNDLDRLKDIDELYYQSGTSEVKNWVPGALAMRELGVPMTLVDYVPCYRSPAGNGHGMAFAYWRP